MEENNRIPVTIYQVDKSLFQYDDFEFIVNDIIRKADGAGFKFLPDKLAIEKIRSHSFKTYYHVKPPKPPRWRGFLKSILADDAILANASNKSHSFLCFIHYSDFIFLLCGGIGSIAVGRFLSQNFGMEILVRLFQKHDRVVRSSQDRGVSGIVLGQQRFYRGDQRFTDENEFGKVYRQFQAQIKKGILTDVFRFHPDDIKRKGSGCTAKGSFQIGKAVDFETLLQNIETYVELLKKERNFTLNKVTPISKKGAASKRLIQELKEHLVYQLYDDCVNNRESDLDFCHPDFETYRNASEYIIWIDPKTTIVLEDTLSLDSIIDEIRRLDRLVIDDADTFKISVLECRIKTNDEDGNLLTNGSVLDHIHGEINYKGDTYFLIDGDWYHIHPDFIADLNDGCANVLEQAWAEDFFKEPFDLNKDESEFNLQFVGQPNTFVFDTITPDNIEACDILRYDDQAAYFIHVKRGFNNSMRDLASQVAVAAKTILADRKTGYNYIDKLQEQTKDGLFSNSPNKRLLAKQAFPAEGIKSILQARKDKSVVFCLAFVDEATVPRSLKANIIDFKSNIAKYSIIELYTQINSLGFDLKIIQVKGLPLLKGRKK